MHRLIVALAPSLFLIISSSAQAQTPIQGTWQGQYICSGIPYALTLTVSDVDQTKIGARATVQPGVGIAVAEFEMTGSMDSAGQFELRPTRLLNRVPGFRPAGYRGRLSSDNRNATASVIYPGCGEFSLQRTAQGTAVTQQAPSRPLSSPPVRPVQQPQQNAPVQPSPDPVRNA